jgi:hypothetical protein
MKGPVMNLPLTRSLSNSSSRGNLRSPNSGAGDLGSSTTMRQNLKLLSVAILCFFGGMQFDSGSVVQVNFSSHEASHEINNAPPQPSSSSSAVGNPSGNTDAPPLPPPVAIAAQSKSSQAAVTRSAEITTVMTKKQPQSTQSPEVVAIVQKKKKQSSVKIADSTTPIERIVLLGERHSGTNWITDHLDECFGDRVIVSIYHPSSTQRLALIYLILFALFVRILHSCNS